MKILVIGDLHGRKPKLKTNDFDLILFVGDVCSDKKIAKFYKKWFNFLNKNPNSKYNSLDDFLKDNFKNVNYDKLLEESLFEGRKILKYLNSFEKPIFMVPGNWDQSYGPTRVKDLDKSRYHQHKAFLDFWLGSDVNKNLIDGLKYVYDCQFKVRSFKDFDILGYGLSSAPEKINIKKNSNKQKKLNLTNKQIDSLKSSEKKIKDKLKRALKTRDKSRPLIFISHNIIYNTCLDVVQSPDSYANNLHLGSSIAREFCVYQKPFLCVGGHIHEGGGEIDFKSTKVINPGFLGQVLVEICGDKVEKVEFLTKTRKEDCSNLKNSIKKSTKKHVKKFFKKIKDISSKSKKK